MKQLVVRTSLVMSFVAGAACVVDGVDPDRTPILPEGITCADDEVVIRSNDAWLCSSLSRVDVDRTPVLNDGVICAAGETVIRTQSGWSCAPAMDDRVVALPESETCRPGQVLIRTSAGWTCGSPSSGSLSVDVVAATSCGEAGGSRVTVAVGDESPATFEICNGAAGTTEVSIPEAFGGWRARAAVSLPQGGLPLPRQDISRQRPAFLGEDGLEITTLPGTSPDASVALPCSNGGPSTPDCGGRTEQLGVSFVAPGAGVYRVCATLNHELASTSATAGHVHFLLARTRDNNGTILSRGAVEQAHGLAALGARQLIPLHLCDQFEATSPGRLTIRLGLWQGGAIALSELSGPAIFEVERLRPLSGAP